MKLRIILITILMFAFGCAQEDQAEQANEILIVRVPRKQLINDLLKQDVQFYQQGQTMTFLVPVDKLFVKNTANESYNDAKIYTSLAKVLNTYRIETIDISAHVHGISSPIAKDYARNLAQTFTENLVRHGIKANNVLTKGIVHKELTEGSVKYMGNYFKIQFRYLRILV